MGLVNPPFTFQLILISCLPLIFFKVLYTLFEGDGHFRNVINTKYDPLKQNYSTLTPKILPGFAAKALGGWTFQGAPVCYPPQHPLGIPLDYAQRPPPTHRLAGGGEEAAATANLPPAAPLQSKGRRREPKSPQTEGKRPSLREGSREPRESGGALTQRRPP